MISLHVLLPLSHLPNEKRRQTWQMLRSPHIRYFRTPNIVRNNPLRLFLNLDPRKPLIVLRFPVRIMSRVRFSLAIAENHLAGIAVEDVVHKPEIHRHTLYESLDVSVRDPFQVDHRSVVPWPRTVRLEHAESHRGNGELA